MMRRRQQTVGWMLLLLLHAGSGSAATIGVYFDPNGNVNETQAGTFSQFTFYVVVKGVSGGILGYEFGIDTPDAISVTNHTIFPAGSLNLGSGQEFIVGMGECGLKSGSGLVVQFSAILLTAGTNLRISVRGQEASANAGGPPAYVTCDSEFYEFDDTQHAYLNPSAESVGKMKERFDN